MEKYFVLSDSGMLSLAHKIVFTKEEAFADPREHDQVTSFDEAGKCVQRYEYSISKSEYVGRYEKNIPA